MDNIEAGLWIVKTTLGSSPNKSLTADIVMSVSAKTA
jgi:hypothetical protein